MATRDRRTAPDAHRDDAAARRALARRAVLPRSSTRPSRTGGSGSRARRYAAGLARAGVQRGRQGLPHLSDVRGVLLHVLRRAAPGRGAGAALPHARRGGDGRHLPRLRGRRGGDHRLVPPGRGRERGAGARTSAPILEPPDLDSRRGAPPLAEAAGPTTSPSCSTRRGAPGSPRGVMLTPRNVVATIQFMAEAAGITVDDRVVSWLPLYHDMGLIGCAFTPPLTRHAALALAARTSAIRGSGWSSITEVRATFTVSPDFGYRNCVRNVRDTAGARPHEPQGRALGRRARARLDHRGVRVALRPQARDRALLRPGRGHAGRRHLAARRAAAARPSRRFLSVGRPCRGVSVRIMSRAPTTTGDRRAAARRRGRDLREEPGRHAGLLQQPRGDGEGARAPTAGSGPATSAFLDAEGFLYVTGRLKDLIILGGENVVPADIEEVVDARGRRALLGRRRHRQRADGHAAAARRGRGAERGGGAPSDYADLVREIVSRVHRASGHRPARVLLVPREHHPQDVQRQDPALAPGRDDRSARVARPPRHHLSVAETRPAVSAPALTFGCHLPVYGPAATREVCSASRGAWRRWATTRCG